MVEGGGHRRRGVVGDAGGNAARGIGLDRCSRTSTSITCSTCGPTSGGGTRAATSSSCASPTTTSWAFSMGDAARFLGELREQAREVWLGAGTREDAADRVRAVRRRATAERGVGKPETFEFLGFTHICGKTRQGRFKLKRITEQEAVARKAARAQGRRCGGACTCRSPSKGAGSARSFEDTYNYYAVPGNFHAVAAFRDQVDPPLVSGASAPQPAQSPDLGADAPPRSLDGYPPPRSCIPGLTRASTLVPKAGAQCVRERPTRPRSSW